MPTQLNKLERYALALFILLLALSGGLYLYQQSLAPTATAKQFGGDFTLNSIAGPVSLSDFKGRGVIMMFGFASCPDVCPTGLATVGAAMRRLTPDQQAQVQPIFISVDPDRDTPELLDQYSRYFYPTMLGLTASKAEIDTVVRAYGAFYQKVDMPDSTLGYSVDHSTRIYLMERSGKLAQLLYHNTPVADVSAALENILNTY